MSNRKPRQLEFVAAGLAKTQRFFGGSLLKRSHAKRSRPLTTKLPLHLVLKSSQARGSRFLLNSRNAHVVFRITNAMGKKYGVRIYEYANAGDHLHMLIKLSNRHLWRPFIRELTGRIAMHVTGAKKGDGQKKSFWDQRPFTRIVDGWRRAYRIAKDYVALNQLEALFVMDARHDLQWKFSSA